MAIELASPKIVLIAAPLGFGKSAYVRRYAARFARMQARRCAPGQHVDDLLLQVRAAAADLEANEPWLLVLEDADVLEMDVLLDFVRQAIPALQGGTLAVTTSRAPPPKLLQAFSANDVTIVLRSDIAFDLKNIESHSEYADFDASTLFRVAAITQGWSAPMQIMARQIAKHETSVDLFDIQNEMWNAVFDWISNRIIDPLPDDIRDALIAATTFGDLTVDDFGDYDGRESRIATVLCNELQLADNDDGKIHVLPLLRHCIYRRYGGQMRDAAESIVGTAGSVRRELREIRSLVATGKFSIAEKIVREIHVLHLAEYPYPGLILEYLQRSTAELSSFPKLWLALLPSRRAFCPRRQLLEEARSAVEAALPNRFLRNFLWGVLGVLFAEAHELDRAREVLARLRGERGGKVFGEAVALFVALEEGAVDEARARYHKVRSTLIRYPAWYRYLRAEMLRAEKRRAFSGESTLFGDNIVGTPRLAPASYADGAEAVYALTTAWLRGDDHAVGASAAVLLRRLYRGGSPMLWRTTAAAIGIELNDVESGDASDDAFSAMFLAERATAENDRQRFMQGAIESAAASGMAGVNIAAAMVREIGDRRASAKVTAPSADAAENNGPREKPLLRRYIDVLVRRFGKARRTGGDVEYKVFVDIVRGTVSSRDGVRMRVSERTLALLALLVTEGAGIRRERAIDLLWPELDADASSNAFKAALHRARKQLGHSGAIQLSDGELSLAPSVRSNFRNLVDFAAGGDPRRDAEAMAAILQAVAEESWAWAPWEWFAERALRMREAARSIGLALAAAQSEAKDWPATIATCRATIALEPFDGVSRATLARAHRAMGNEALAIAEIRSYEGLLKEELGLALPEDLRVLARSGA